MHRFHLTAATIVALLAARPTVAQGTPAQPSTQPPAAASQAPLPPLPSGGVRFTASNPQAAISQMVEVGNTIYLSGMLGTTPDGQLAPGGIDAEVRQALENIRSALGRTGATMDDIVKCTVYLADIGEITKMNAVYTTFFPTHRPARSTVGVAGLVRSARAEIECLAVRGAASAK